MSRPWHSFQIRVAVFAVCGSIAVLGQDHSTRPAFEVASVKPSAADDANVAMKRAMEMMQGMQNDRDPGFIPKNRAHITLQKRSLASLVATAYKVRSNQVMGPAWISEDQFDVEAKMPDNAPPESANEMLQALLEERFALKVHRETKTLPGFALTVGKGGPKLQLAGAEAPAAPNTDELKAQNEARMAKMAKEMEMRGYVGGGASRRWQRATMSEVALGISQMVHAPVTDMTGLTDKYEVSIVVPGPQDSADSIEGRVALAIEKLGLKLEPRKVPVEAVVVDSASKMPTAN